MKHKILFPCLLISSPFITQQAVANNGVINFKGSIVKSSCDTSNKSIDVPMGTWPTTALAAAGQTTSPKTFQINLQNCEAGNYRVRLDGNSYDSGLNANLLALTPGGATGVGIKIQSADADSKNIALNQDLNDAYFVSAQDDKTAVFNLKAFYYAVAPATEGTANSVANFSIEYK